MTSPRFKNIMAGSTIVAINAEISRQEALKASGKFERTCAEMAAADNLVVCAEEFGEVAEDVRSGNHTHMREEILQLITCLVRWYEADEQHPAQFPVSASQDVVERAIALGAAARAVQEQTDAAA